MGMNVASSSGGGGRRGRRKPVVAEINVTPMVDVMLVLLIIFMVSAPMLTVGVPLGSLTTLLPTIGEAYFKPPATFTWTLPPVR